MWRSQGHALRRDAWWANVEISRPWCAGGFFEISNLRMANHGEAHIIWTLVSWDVPGSIKFILSFLPWCDSKFQCPVVILCVSLVCGTSNAHFVLNDCGNTSKSYLCYSVLTKYHVFANVYQLRRTQLTLWRIWPLKWKVNLPKLCVCVYLSIQNIDITCIYIYTYIWHMIYNYMYVCIHIDMHISTRSHDIRARRRCKAHDTVRLDLETGKAIWISDDEMMCWWCIFCCWIDLYFHVKTVVVMACWYCCLFFLRSQTTLCYYLINLYLLVTLVTLRTRSWTMWNWSWAIWWWSAVVTTLVVWVPSPSVSHTRDPSRLSISRWMGGDAATYHCFMVFLPFLFGFHEKQTISNKKWSNAAATCVSIFLFTCIFMINIIIIMFASKGWTSK